MRCVRFRFRWFQGMALLAGALWLAGGCVTATAPGPPTYMAVSPMLAYLRHCPAYECQIVREVYKADEVEVLEKRDDGWYRVRPRGGIREGWIQAELLTSGPVEVEKLYVTAPGAPLREAPGKEAPFRVKLQRGDRVQKIDDNGQGWWRVLSEKDKAVGWLPSGTVAPALAAPAAAAPAPVAQPHPKATYFVAIPTMNIYSLPLFSSKPLKELHLNDRVEKVAESDSAWVKVRHVASGAEGWAASRYLKDAPVPPPTPTRKPKPKRKKTAPASPAGTPEEEEAVLPEAM